MAITGISAISGEQIIAAGAVSAKEAGKASFTTGGNDIQNLYDTVYTNSASWAEGGPDYSAGKNISIAGDVISTTDTISVTGDVQVENSIETEVTSVAGTQWGTDYYGHYASLNSSYKVTVSGTPANLGVYVYDFDHGGYYVNGLTTADLQNFTITGLSSLPNAVTSKQGDWSTTEWFEGAEFGIYDLTYNPGYDGGMPAWPVSSTLYSLEGSNISLSGLNDFVSTNSASWTASGPSYTGDAQGALDEVYTNSANWDGSYDTLTANSAYWTAAGNTLGSNSGKWSQTYNTVSGNSATWGGSVLNVSAGPGVKINLVDDTLVFGADETVLWSGSCKYHNSATLSEKPINFDRLRFYWKDWNSNATVHVSECTPNYTTSSNYAFGDTWAGAGSANLVLFNLILNDDFDKTIYFKWGTFYNCTANSVTQATQTEIVKIVGVNRTAGNN